MTCTFLGNVVLLVTISVAPGMCVKDSTDISCEVCVHDIYTPLRSVAIYLRPHLSALQCADALLPRDLETYLRGLTNLICFLFRATRRPTRERLRGGSDHLW